MDSLNPPSEREQLGRNDVHIEGEVLDDPIFSKTGKGSPCSSFLLRVYGARPGRESVVVRVNWYDSAVEQTRSVKKDQWLSVMGSLTTRRTAKEGRGVIEVKGQKLVLH